MEKVMDTDYTKDELMVLAFKIAAKASEDWRNGADDLESWEHYETLRKAFLKLAEEAGK